IKGFQPLRTASSAERRMWLCQSIEIPFLNARYVKEGFLLHDDAMAEQIFFSTHVVPLNVRLGSPASQDFFA
ncbi:MAG: hypothetical protein AAB570_01765, partial [Patescibacteria group bacterium]